MEIHNGQGLGVTSGKLTAIISDGGGSKVGMVGSEWLTSIPIQNSMVVVAQLVRALVCGTRGREFDSPQSPQKRDVVQLGRTLALGARGRWFKSSHLDKKMKKK